MHTVQVGQHEHRVLRAGRLFYAPDAAKLSTAMIWEAVKDNRLKLPNTISIDRFGLRPNAGWLDDSGRI